MNKTHVLVTCVGSNTSISVIKGLKRQTEFEVYVVGTDINDRESIAGSFFCDAFYKVPAAKNSQLYIEAILKIIEEESINLVIPVNNVELEVMAHHRTEIEKSCFLLLASDKVIDICNDKIKMFEFFVKNGVPTAKTVEIKNPNSFEEILNQGISFPFIAKPRKGIASKGVFEIRDKEDFYALVKDIDDPVFQEKIAGQEYDIDIFGDGERLISAVPRKRIESRSGIAYKARTERNQRIIEFSRKIVEELKIKGPAHIQCFVNKEGVKIIDLNPTFSGSLILPIEAGVNSPLLALKMSVGANVQPIENFKIVMMCRYLNEVFYPSSAFAAAEVVLTTGIGKLPEYKEKTPVKIKDEDSILKY